MIRVGFILCLLLRAQHIASMRHLFWSLKQFVGSLTSQPTHVIKGKKQNFTPDPKFLWKMTFSLVKQIKTDWRRWPEFRKTQTEPLAEFTLGNLTWIKHFAHITFKSSSQAAECRHLSRSLCRHDTVCMLNTQRNVSKKLHAFFMHIYLCLSRQWWASSYHLRWNMNLTSSSVSPCGLRCIKFSCVARLAPYSKLIR